jgi:hypothetical protein
MQSTRPEKSEASDGGNRAGFGVMTNPVRKDNVMDATGTLSVEQVKDLLGDIALLAHQSRRMAYHFCDANEDPESAEMLIVSLRDAACRMGFMADRALQHLGEGAAILSSADEWLMSPTYVDHGRAASKTLTKGAH